MDRRDVQARKSFDSTGQQDPLKQKLFFQELPSDLQQMVFKAVMFRLSRSPLAEDSGLLELDDLLHEEADHCINCHNRRRTVAEWLEFAENGE